MDFPEETSPLQGGKIIIPKKYKTPPRTRRGGLVHVLTGGCREGSQVFLSPFFHRLAFHFMSRIFFSPLFLPHWPSLYAERPPMRLPCMATRVGGNVCPGS